MGLFEDLSRFLENRLDEFLKANPHLELMALEEQLRGQEEDAINLLGTLKRRQQQLEDSILETAQAIQRWHERIKKAQAANREDLAQPAQAREAALLREGNHLWGANARRQGTNGKDAPIAAPDSRSPPRTQSQNCGGGRYPCSGGDHEPR
jgi:uncharacterized protein (TIGR04376 family)